MCDEKDRVRFVKVISEKDKFATHPKIEKYSSSCSTFDSLLDL